MSTAQPQPSSIRRIANFLRFWLHVRANVTVLLHNQSQIATALQNSAAIINRLTARLEWYEREILLMGKAGASFRAHEQKLIKAAEAHADYEAREARRAAETQQQFNRQPDQRKPQLEVVSR